MDKGLAILEFAATVKSEADYSVNRIGALARHLDANSVPAEIAAGIITRQIDRSGRSIGRKAGGVTPRVTRAKAGKARKAERARAAIEHAIASADLVATFTRCKSAVVARASGAKRDDRRKVRATIHRAELLAQAGEYHAAIALLRGE